MPDAPLYKPFPPSPPSLQVISDLLKPESSNLVVREDKRRGVHVEGLSEWVVRSPAGEREHGRHGGGASEHEEKKPTDGSTAGRTACASSKC